MLKTEIKSIIEKESSNVAIFCDYDNIHYGLTTYGLNLQNPKYDIFHLMNELYGKSKIRTLQAFGDFEQLNISMKHLQLNRVQIQNVFANSKNESNRKNASDIELAIKTIETYYENKKIDTFVFLTSDSDMIPIMNYLLYKGKNVHLYYINQNANSYLINFCNLAIDLLELMEINIERKNVEYWIPTIEKILTNYTSSFGENKLLSHKWLMENFQKESYMPTSLCNQIILKMQELGVIEKIDNNPYFGYKLKK